MEDVADEVVTRTGRTGLSFSVVEGLASIKVEGQEASKQFKEGGDSNEPKCTTTKTVPKTHKF